MPAAVPEASGARREARAGAAELLGAQDCGKGLLRSEK